MKVSLQGDRLVNIGKKLAADQVDAESIGMILFRERGPSMFRNAIEKALDDPSAISENSNAMRFAQCTWRLQSEIPNRNKEPLTAARHPLSFYNLLHQLPVFDRIHINGCFRKGNDYGPGLETETP